MSTIYPAQKRVSSVICLWFLDACLFFRFLAFSACSFGSFCAITRTKTVLFLYLQNPKISIMSWFCLAAFFSMDVGDIFCPSASYRQNVFGVLLGITSACWRTAEPSTRYTSFKPSGAEAGLKRAESILWRILCRKETPLFHWNAPRKLF